MVSYRVTLLSFLLSFATSLIVSFIKFTYSLSNKSFQKPGHLGLLLFVRCNVIRERSVLKPGEMPAFVIIVLRLELIKKKSKRQCISGFLLLSVNLLASGLKIRQISTRSNKLAMYKTSFNEFYELSPGFLLFCLFRPPELSYNPLRELTHCSRKK